MIETAEADDGIRAAFTSVDTDVRTSPSSCSRPCSSSSASTAPSSTSGTRRGSRPPGNRHPIVVITDSRVFDGFVFDPGAVRAFMDAQGWPATITVLHRIMDAPARRLRFEARNLFPVGRITEDPATGSAAAAVGGYLRALGAVTPPQRVLIEQGRHVGRPGELTVDIPERGGIVVSGRAVSIR